MKNIDKQLSYAPAEVHISYCGFASPAMQQMQDLFKKQITLLCYEKSKSVEELSEILQTDKVFIQDAVNSLTSLKMMKCENGKYLTTFPMIHKKKNYDAEKMNYELLGNGDSHLHWHLFPRVSGDLENYGNKGKGPVWWLPKEIMWSEDNKPSPDELEDMKTKLLIEIEKLL